MRHVRVDTDERRVEIVLDHPPVNVLTLEVIEELDGAVQAAASASRAALVLRAAGGTFSAGVDVAAHVPEKVEAMLETFHRLVRRLWEHPCVSIAVVDGAALGGGCELVTACDLVVASDRARFGQPEIELACFPPVAAAVLPGRIGWQRACELVLLGEPIDAATAARWGLVNRLASPSGLDEALDELLDRLASLSRAALQAARQALRAGAGERRSALQGAEDVYRTRLAATDDMAEGVRAFLEKRRPRWKHR